MTDKQDERFMRAALSVGRRGTGTTSPNPSVGCVLTQGADADARIVARGWTAPGGRPHAETEAVRAAGRLASGAVAYVTLEPCSHHGKTPPCAHALIDAGVRRVVVALEDPDPRVRGRGVRILQDAGVDVTHGVLADAARRDLAGYFSRVTHQRPHVTLKLAVSKDGKIAAAGAVAPTPITGDLARRRGHLMRADSDVIAVGRNTAIVDNPMLSCRLDGLEARSPIRVVFDTRLELTSDSRLAATAREIPVWVLTGQDALGSRAVALERAGVNIIPVRRGANGSVDLAAGLGVLAERGVNTILIEGGARIASALLRADLVDEVALFRAPVMVGPGGLNALCDLPLTWITASERFRQVCEMPLGPDRLIAYERVLNVTSDHQTTQCSPES